MVSQENLLLTAWSWEFVLETDWCHRLNVCNLSDKNILTELVLHRIFRLKLLICSRR